MFISHQQNAEQNHNLITDNKSFENIPKFIYSGMAVTNQNCITKENQRRLNLGNDCYYSVQNLLSLCVLSKNLKIKLHSTTILPVVFMGWKLGLTH
jgi:hypothetical protein